MTVLFAQPVLLAVERPSLGQKIKSFDIESIKETKLHKVELEDPLPGATCYCIGMFALLALA